MSRAVDGIKPFLRCEISHPVGDHHVDRRKAGKLVAAVRAGVGVKGDLRICTLVVIAGKQLTTRHLHPSATDLAAGMEEFLELAGALVERRRHAAAGRYEQVVARRHEVALRCHAAVLMPPSLVARGVVQPDLPSGLRLQCRHV